MSLIFNRVTVYLDNFIFFHVEISTHVEIFTCAANINSICVCLFVCMRTCVHARVDSAEECVRVDVQGSTG